jgi:uncharacterized protein YbjT (DUF2867 family)
MILITGATGNIGGEALRLLGAMGKSVRALSRDPSRLEGRAHGAELAQGDLLKPETLSAALEGVERALLVCGAEDLPQAAKNLVASKPASLRHVVLISSYTIGIGHPTVIGNWHLEAEEALQASDLAWTMLRPGNFSTNTLRWAGPVRAQGAVYAPASGRSAPIDTRDIASVAVRALTSPGHEGKTYTLTSERLMTAAEQVDTIGAALGKPLRYVEVPDAGAKAGMMKSGMPELMADAVLELMRAGRDEHEALVTPDVRDVTGSSPRNFDVWVNDFVAAFQ